MHLVIKTNLNKQNQLTEPKKEEFMKSLICAADQLSALGISVDNLC